MEIERKFKIDHMPEHFEQYPSSLIEQAYLCTDPVIRVRRDGSHYYMTYKGGGMMEREEVNLWLSAEAYQHMKKKSDGLVITKIRYRIPLQAGLTAELDVFQDILKGLVFVEVEFETKEDALAFTPPDWFGEEVTYDPRYHNSSISKGAVPPFTPVGS